MTRRWFAGHILKVISCTSAVGKRRRFITGFRIRYTRGRELHAEEIRTLQTSSDVPLPSPLGRRSTPLDKRAGENDYRRSSRDEGARRAKTGLTALTGKQ
jgi:hypothetical protein